MKVETLAALSQRFCLDERSATADLPWNGRSVRALGQVQSEEQERSVWGIFADACSAVPKTPFRKETVLLLPIGLGAWPEAGAGFRNRA